MSINLDGAFGADPRREIEVSGTPGGHPVSDIAFDARDHMYVAQRGGIEGSYDYSIFADAKRSVVFRFMREIPDDPVTPGIWIPIPDEYAIGLPPDHRNASGGLTLGLGHDRAGAVRPGACDMTIWTTGDSLLSDASSMQEAAAQEWPIVHGLQGTDPALTRPDNEPPAASRFIDYDGLGGDPQKQGHVGDVEIWQPCEPGDDAGAYAPAADLQPDHLPPGEAPEDGVSPGDVPPDGTPERTYNLRLEKRPVPGACAAGGLGFLCDYVVRVTNTGPDAYVGPIVVNDRLPAAPVGAVMTLSNAPPWLCFAVSPTEHQCTYGPGALLSGESVDLHVAVDLPVAAPVCHLDNQAGLVWAWGAGDADAADDFDLATATIPAPHCPPPAGEKTNLRISKHPLADVCADKGGFFECRYNVEVRNAGAAVYDGIIEVDDTIPAGATAAFGPAAWSCAGPAPTYSCQRGPVALLPGQTVNMNAVVKVPKNLAGPLQCQAKNEAKIVAAAGGTDQNTDPTDDGADATAILPGELAQCPGLPGMSNLKLGKTGPDAKCPVSGGSWECRFTVTVQNFGKAYTAPVQFIDALPFGSPAGATVTFQPPAGWNCGGPALFPNLYQCGSDNPNLAHLDKVEIPVTVRIPVAPLAKCEVTNNAEIVKAPGGTLLNAFAGDDKSSAKARLMPAFPPDGSPPVCLSANLRLEKTRANGIECPVSGGRWACDFELTVTNLGDDPYTSEIQILDALPTGTPAGATMTFAEPPGWDCGGPLLSPNLYQCRSENPKLAKGESTVIPVTVNIPVGTVQQCYVANKAQIVKAPGDSPANADASDDSSWAAMKFKKDVPLPGGGVACPSPKQSNLKVEKTKWASSLCQVSGNIWVCEWKVRITNTGPDAFASPLEFVDELVSPPIPPAGATLMLSQPAGWTCQHPAPPRAVCRSENPALAAGESVEFAATVRIPLNPVGPAAECAVKNSAHITAPKGLTPHNFVWADDMSSSTLQLAPYLPPGFPNVPAVCLGAATGEPQLPLATPEGKESNLTIAKTAAASQVTASGQSTMFTITVTNEGPGVFNGPIEIRDTLFDGVTVEPSNGSWSAPWVCEGQSALGHPEQGVCTHPAVELDPGESVVLDLEIEAPNSFVAPSGSEVRCGYTNKVEILDPAGGSAGNTNTGDDAASAVAEFAPFEKHGTTFCGLGLTTPPPSAVCPQGWSRTPVAGKCCPPRSSWDGERCRRDVKQPEEKCPANSVGDYPHCRCKAGYTGTSPNCRKIDDPERCAGGMERIGGECRCPRGMRFRDGKCRTPPSGPEKTCGVNEVGAYPDCRCAKGFTGSPPNCKPAACPPGTRGKFPDCRRIDCPANQRWIDGACRCRSGLKWTGRRCVADTPRACPADSVGSYPDCRCKRGTTGKPGHCKRIADEPRRCPEGFRGKPPKCKRIVDEPRRCPEGFRGKPPKCKRIVDEPRRCPEGFRGRPPKCKRIGSNPL
ncbi:MAG: hypothetical protein AB7S92_23485 [Parvibaculaceae bacterium]